VIAVIIEYTFHNKTINQSFFCFYSLKISFETGNICSFKKTKISINEIIKVFQWVNISYSEKVQTLPVKGRDDTIGLSLKILRIPMLFVGINDPDK
jgi:hypothetical protein